MAYSSVWTRLPAATVPVMTGSIVLCRTSDSMCSTTWPPRWIRPRTGGLSFAAVPRPGAPSSLRRRPSRPFWPPPPAGPCGPPPRRPRRSPPRPLIPRPGRSDQTLAQLFRHGLNVGRAQAQLQGDLPVGQVQAHEVEAQHPDSQRLVAAGQRRAGEVVEAPGARLAAIPLPIGLSVVAPVPDHRAPAATGAAHPLRPAALAHKAKHLASSIRPERSTKSAAAMVA